MAFTHTQNKFLLTPPLAFALSSSIFLFWFCLVTLSLLLSFLFVYCFSFFNLLLFFHSLLFFLYLPFTSVHFPSLLLSSNYLSISSFYYKGFFPSTSLRSPALILVLLPFINFLSHVFFSNFVILFAFYLASSEEHPVYHFEFHLVHSSFVHLLILFILHIICSISYVTVTNKL